MKSFAEHQGINLIEGAFNIGIASSDTDNKDVNKLVKYLQNKSGSELVMVSNSKGQVKVRREFTDDIKDILAWIEDNGLKIPWGTTKIGDGSVGEGGVKISESTQEIMVAALVLNKYKGGTLSTEEAVKVIDNAKKKFNKVQGASGRPELLDQFDSNFNDLATAISSSNAILKEVPNPVKAYWTGQGWHKDIAKYNPKIGNIKDYNSSDIVVKSGNGKFYGFSLKKKGATSVMACCTHGVLSGPAYDRIANGVLDELIVSDTIPTRKDAKKITVLTASVIIGETIRRIQNNESVNSIFIA